jgi:uncharacterized protein YggU (UPF0235/DUF167 family)
MSDTWQSLLGTEVQVRVTPNASSARIVPDYDEDGALSLRVYVTTQPEDGKANKAVIALLSKTLKRP